MPSDLIGTVLAKSGIPAAFEVAKDFVDRLLGPAAEEAGLLIGDQVRSYRLRNSLRILANAQEQLQEAGIDPETVPLRTLVPLLEGASLEEDVTLSAMWSGLIASAAAGKKGQEVPPAFPEILRQMAPEDAAVLERMFVNGRVSRPRAAGTSENFPASEKELSVSNLARLGLVRLALPRDAAERDAERGRSSRFHVPFRLDQHMVVLTPLGEAFLKACLGPETETKV